MTCEKCWGDAYLRTSVLGGSQTEHYHELLAERVLHACTVEEQAGVRETATEIDAYIAKLRYPKLAAYVVGHLAKDFDVTRDNAVRLWDAHVGRR